jgi:predicted transcriptional regulator
MTTLSPGAKPAKWVESFRLSLSPDLHQRVKEQAEREESTVSQITRHALRRYLEEQKR